MFLEPCCLCVLHILRVDIKLVPIGGCIFFYWMRILNMATSLQSLDYSDWSQLFGKILLYLYIAPSFPATPPPQINRKYYPKQKNVL